MKILNYLKKNLSAEMQIIVKRSGNYKEESRKIGAFICQDKSHSRAENRKMNNTEERINDLEDQIMVFTQSKQWEAK